jgi:hypothetical protein
VTRRKTIGNHQTQIPTTPTRNDFGAVEKPFGAQRVAGDGNG